MPDPKTLLCSPGVVAIRRRKRYTPQRVTWFWLVRRDLQFTVCFTPFRGFCVRSVRRGRGHQADYLCVLPAPETSVKRVQIGVASGSTLAEHLAAMECNTLAGLQGLVKHCAVTKYEDGTPRMPGWWTVQTRGAAWQVVVKDPDSGCKLVATGNSLDDALVLAEMLLTSEEAPWEPDPYLKSKQNGRKKSS